MLRKIISVTVFVLMPLVVGAQHAKVIERIIEAGSTDNRTMDHLDVISNRFGGRLSGSDAYENAALWCASQFSRWGMEVIMDEAGTVPVGFNRGPWFGRLLSDNGMTLHFATPSYTSGTKGVQRGHVLIEPKTIAEFNSMKEALKGAWVLIGGKNSGMPIDHSPEGDSLRANIIVYNDSIRKVNQEIARDNSQNPMRPPVAPLPLREEPALLYREMVEAGILGIIQ